MTRCSRAASCLLLGILLCPMALAGSSGVSPSMFGARAFASASGARGADLSLAAAPGDVSTLAAARLMSAATSLPLLPHPRRLPDRRIFARAAARSGVPIDLLLAVSYVQSYWSDHGGSPSVDGGYGLMDLVHNAERDTLHAAARLLRVAPHRLPRDDALNVLGGALLLARAARALSPRHALPRTLGGWAPAVVWLTGMRTRLAAQAVLRDVYGLLAHGMRPRARLGGIARHPLAAPDLGALAPLLLRPVRGSAATRAEYPMAIWAPSPNYTPARRPRDLAISYVVIHDTEGSCASALNWLDNPWAQASAHFLVCQDGTVYQLVRVRDIAWHAGNWFINQHSIGIEHEGFRDSGGYTQAQYDASAAIVQWLDSAYGLSISLDRNSIYGHENVPNGGHTDPGPLWNWPYYMRQVRGDSSFDAADPAIAMIDVPSVLVYSCPFVGCTIYGSANWGEQYAVVARQQGWLEVCYGGTMGWLAADAVTAGAGQKLKVTIARLNVRDEPSYAGNIMGVLGRGQVYVSRLLDSALDQHGWWLIALNHRYGFISSRFVQPVGSSVIAVGTIAPATATPRRTATPIARAAASATAAALESVTATPSADTTPTSSPTVTPPFYVTATPTATTNVTATTSGTASPYASVTVTATITTTPQADGTPTLTTATGSVTAGPVSATATLPATATLTAGASSTGTVTATASATMTATASPTATATPTSSATPTPSPTETPTATATPSPSPTSTPTATATATSTPRPTPPRLRSVAVKLARAHVRLGAPLRLSVRANVGPIAVRYLIVLPGATIRAQGRGDVHGNARQAFIMPGASWLHAFLLDLKRRHHLAALPSPPHSVGGTYHVTVAWRGHVMTRSGAFRLVLWGSG